MLEMVGAAGFEPTSVVASEAPAASETVVPSASASAAFEAISLKGTGKKVEKFTIPEGSAAIAEATHVGKSNFAIVTLAADGSNNDLLVNTIGNYKGSTLFDETDDEHSVAMEIDAVGAWTVVIKPASAARPWDGTTPLKGVGDDVVLQSPPSSGLVTLDLTYKGDSNFAVNAYSSDGVDLLANEIGDFTGQVREPDGTFLLEVSADGGAWTITPG